MDSKYIINRLKSTPYKHSTVDLLRIRLENLDEINRSEIMLDLKIELSSYYNVDIHESLRALLDRKECTSFMI